MKWIRVYKVSWTIVVRWLLRWWMSDDRRSHGSPVHSHASLDSRSSPSLHFLDGHKNRHHSSNIEWNIVGLYCAFICCFVTFFTRDLSLSCKLASITGLQVAMATKLHHNFLWPVYFLKMYGFLGLHWSVSSHHLFESHSFFSLN